MAGLTHKGTAFVFLDGRCQSCGVRSPSCSVSVVACARCQSRCAQSPRREESRVIASSVVLRRVCHLVVRRPPVSRVPFSFSDSMDDVFFRPVLTRRVFFLF